MNLVVLPKGTSHGEGWMEMLCSPRGNIEKARNRLRSGFGLLVSAGRVFVRLMPQSDLAAAHTAWKALLPSERRVDYGQTARFTASHGLRAVYIAFGFAPGPPAAGRGQAGQERGNKVK